jgi:glycosyltransferase involved in cell wall biosynthesis
MSVKRRRILYVQGASAGGAVISLYELIRSLDTNLYEPMVLFHRPSAHCEQFQALGAKVVVLGERPLASASGGFMRGRAAGFRNHGGWANVGYHTARAMYLTLRHWPTIHRVAGLIRDEKVDLVHHGNSLNGNRASIIAARLAAAPQLCHVRGLEKFSHFDRYMSRFVKTFIYISKAVEQCYRDQGIPANRGQVIYNPIDVDAFSELGNASELRAEFGIDGQERLISNVGNISWWKGQDDFLHALGLVIQTQPRTKALLVGEIFASPVNQSYYQKLKRLVSEFGLSNRVIFTGFRPDIPRIMAASDVIVHSSSEPEPFGRVVVEGMAAGRPVIATAGGGVLDVIEDHVTGLLVPLKNPPLMAKAILDLLENPAQARRISQQAQHYIREHFSMKRHARAVQQIYQNILEEA